MTNPQKGWSDFFTSLLEWLKTDFPKLLAAFGVGYKVGAKDKAKTEKELREMSYENEKLKNEKAVRDSANSRDVLAEFIERNKPK